MLAAIAWETVAVGLAVGAPASLIGYGTLRLSIKRNTQVARTEMGALAGAAADRAQAGLIGLIDKLTKDNEGLRALAEAQSQKLDAQAAKLDALQTKLDAQARELAKILEYCERLERELAALKR